MLTVWFDPWMHQFDENPVVALAQTLADNLQSGLFEEGKKLVTVIGAALSSVVLKNFTGLTYKDVMEIGEAYEKERFQVREARVQLQKHFRSLVDTVRGNKRLVFFIDDLDRCMPDKAMNLIEALKLYLNIKDCVYFIGVDRAVLEGVIQKHYKDLDLGMDGGDYLGKIVQLPFTVPLIEPEHMGEYVDTLLPEELSACRELLVEGLGDNPRQVKRFINTLFLNHQLAKPTISNYRPEVLAIILLVQLLLGFGAFRRRYAVFGRVNCRQARVFIPGRDTDQGRGDPDGAEQEPSADGLSKDNGRAAGKSNRFTG